MKNLRFIALAAIITVLLSGVVFIALRVKSVPRQEKAGAPEESLIKEAQDQELKGNLLKVKEVYQKLVRDYPQGKFVLENQKKMWDLNVKLLFSPIATPDSKIYEVQPQDTLGKIAKQSGTTIDLLMKSNNLKSDVIRPGMKLKVCSAKFNILVDKSQNVLTLKENDEIFKVYQVSTGLDNSTPIGTFKITVKLVDPTWYKAGAIVVPGSPKNILGTRWLGLSIQGYGIHGTTEPGSIGKQATAGCVRMLNQEVEELYTIVPSGTEVTVVD